MPMAETLLLISSIIYDLTIALISLPLLFSPRLGLALENARQVYWKSGTFKSVSQHDQEVQRISRHVRHAYTSHQRIVLYRRPGAGHSARSSSYKVGHYRVDVASLDSIISLDKLNQTVTVQAGISFEALCNETLKHGLLPLVVPEFKSITVGGAIQGIGIESSSWNNGAVDESVIEATLVLGDGTVVSTMSVPELWQDVPGSNGTLALVVAAKLRLRLATSTMCVRYEVLEDIESFCNRVNTLEHDVDWSWIGGDRLLDAVWIRDIGIVAMFAGCLLDTEDTSKTPSYIENTFSPFFFQHIQQVAESHLIRKDSVYHEKVPTKQYLFRFDRGGFWGIMALAHSIPLLGFVLARPSLSGCLNHFLRTSTLYKLAMLVSDLERESIAMLQDVDVPHSKSSLITDWAIDHTLTHLWLCPVKNESKSMFSVSKGSEWVLNIGLYGVATGLPSANLELQRLVAKCGGKSALYAHIYADTHEFWSWYDQKRYEALREAYRGDCFLGLWEKVSGITKKIDG